MRTLTVLLLAWLLACAAPARAETRERLSQPRIWSQQQLNVYRVRAVPDSIGEFRLRQLKSMKITLKEA